MGAMDKVAVAHVLASCKSAVSTLGFKKRAGDIYTLPVAPDVIGWLALGHTSYRKMWLEIFPNVGVRHQAVERLVAELLDRPFHQYSPPTLITGLGYVSPENQYTPLQIETIEGSVAPIAKLKDDLRRFGMPFMERYATPGALLEELTDSKYRYSGRDRRTHRLPVALYLAGDLAGARTCLDQGLAERAGRSDAEAIEFSGFAMRLGERMR